MCIACYIFNQSDTTYVKLQDGLEWVTLP